MRLRIAAAVLIVAAAVVLGTWIADFNRRGAERAMESPKACGSACVCPTCTCCKACCGE